MTQLDKSYIGSISEATMRTQDLLPRFISVLAAAEPGHSCVADYREVWEAATKLAEWTNVGNSNAEDVLEALDFWDSEQASYLLNDRVFDALNEVAPEGTYFGSSEGDGASYGFWYVDDECEQCGEHHDSGDPCDGDDPDSGEDAEIEVVS